MNSISRFQYGVTPSFLKAKNQLIHLNKYLTTKTNNNANQISKQS